MRVLVVSPFPPQRDGIASYAEQEVKRLHREGHHVEVFSQTPSAAHHHGDLTTPGGMAALGRLASSFDTTIVHFYPFAIFSNARQEHRAIQLAALRAICSVTDLELRFHEIDFEWYEARPLAQRLFRSVLLACSRVTVHTKTEQARLAQSIGIGSDALEVIDHGSAFTSSFHGSQADARQLLGLRPDRHIFLSIGFLQQHKGFDRSIRSFSALDAADSAEMHVVGSVRVEAPNILRYADELDQLCQATDGATLHTEFCGDRRFDAWLVAADTVVLPYREIWSSSVIERAALHDRIIIASAVGGLADQAHRHTIIHSDHELTTAMATRLGQQVNVEPANAPSLSAAALQGSIDDATAALSQPTDRSASQGLRQMRSVELPNAGEGRPHARLLKQAMRPLISWQTAVLANQVDQLRTRTTEALEQIEERLEPVTPDDRD